MHRYRCGLRWGDTDAHGHLNNAVYIDYLQEARVNLLGASDASLRNLLTSGVLVVQQRVAYLNPVEFKLSGVTVELWVESIGGSRFVIGYHILDGNRIAVVARTVLAPYDLAGQGLRRLTETERSALRRQLETDHDPLPRLPTAAWRGWDLGGPDKQGDDGIRTGSADYPLRLRWSDLDAYGHANNVKYYDYFQEARVELLAPILGFDPVAGIGSDAGWSLSRQDIDYRAPLDFRMDPYRVRTAITEIGDRMLTLAARIEDPDSGAVYAEASTILTSRDPLLPAQQDALRRFAPRRVKAASG